LFIKVLGSLARTLLQNSYPRQGKFKNMDEDTQNIALLLGSSEDERWQPRDFVDGAQCLVRDAEGQFSLQDVATEEEFDRVARTTGCFRRGKPILDPESRDVIGYEMEEVPSLANGATG
jgi:hypothetical protein